MFKLLEKNLSTEIVTLVDTFTSWERAEDVKEELSDIWEEERAYKIVEVA